eukprot:Rhum_TRINITY_DN8082_c0_g1::Rhum_TRINITY_DN8082_c0_g1_i1::g.26089::m.26089
MASQEQDRLALGVAPPASDLEDSDAGEDVGTQSLEQLQLEGVEETPKRTRCPVGSILSLAALFVLNIVSVALTVDQRHGTHSWKMPFDLKPSRHINCATSYVGMVPEGCGQTGGRGAWPERNDKARLSACAVSVATLVVLLLLVLCKSGRRAQVVALLVLQVAAGLHVAACLLDKAALSEGKTQGHMWADAQSLRLDNQRYLATVCVDAFNAFFAFVFSATSLLVLLWHARTEREAAQARRQTP